jgi:hypothetical protein
MIITIHGQDYTAALDAAKPLTIERKLNEPTVCQLWLSLPSDGSREMPLPNQYMTVTGDDGTVYFTGYIAGSPFPEFAGISMSGPAYRTAVRAVSDEILLDQVLMPPSKGLNEQTAGALFSRLVTRTGLNSLSTQGISLSTAISNFVPEPGATWSKTAGQVAGMARAAYRAVNGALALNQAQTSVHALKEGDGRLTPASLTITASVKRALANDITVCGEIEPVAYVTEYFQGDGLTTQFYLAERPYFAPASRASIIRELFNEGQIDLRVWGAGGSTHYFALGAGGLAMNGGNGIDGQTQLSWLDPVEMGGTLLLEAVGITLLPGSTGILAAFYSGMPSISGCIAGVQATAQQGTGAVSLQPILEGTPAGAAVALSPGSQYTVRVRIGCPEQERAQAIYHSFGDDGQITAGGSLISSPGKVQIEVQEFVNGVGAVPVTLYDGSISNLPDNCTIVAASSINLIGSMRALNLYNIGSAWVVSTPAGGKTYTRRLGSIVEAGECSVDRSGKLVFYSGFVPAANEQIAVSYRTTGRAVGRAINAANQQALAQAGSPPVATWIGTVSRPSARSSADCRNAALVMEQAAAGVSALWSGTYKGTRDSFASDVWPGDALALNAPSANLDVQVVVRAVTITYSSTYPDLVEYAIEFANDWADDLAIRTSGTVPEDAWLPAAASPTVLANLNNLTVTTLNGAVVSVDAGISPPAGGGFEIRRRDFAFMPGEDPGLVLRGTSRTMTFARETANDRFYVRLYDGSNPPNYSEFSTALFINLPLGG